MTQGAAIAVTGLCKRYRGRAAVDGIDLQVRHGEIFALLGPNGAGKTTTVEILEGYRSRDHGEVLVLGEDPATAGPQWRSRIGIVLQNTTDAAELTVAELVHHFARFYPRPRDPDQLIDEVGLSEKRRSRVRSLSGGQRRRLDVALGIVGDPQLVFLDEPTTVRPPGATIVLGAGPRPTCGRDHHPAQYYLTGMVSSAVMLTSFQDMANSIAIEREDGTLKRLRGTPMPAVAFFAGKIGQVVIVTMIQLVLLLLVARFAYDVALPETLALWWRFGWLVVLGAAVGTVAGIAFSSVPRSGRSAAAVVTPVAIVLQFISGVFLPFYSLPAWMQAAASVFPLKWLAQGLRSVFLPEQMVHAEPIDSWQVCLVAVVLVAWLLVGLGSSLRTFRWRRRDDG